MDITLENITDLELPEDLENALLTKLEAKATGYLTTKGHIVKPKADYDAEVATLVAAKNKEAIDLEGARLYGSIDNILKLLGMPKPEGVTRTRDHVLNLAAEGKLPLTTAQFEEMKKKLEGKGVSEGKADTIVTELQTKLDKITTDAETKTKEDFEKSTKRVVDSSLKDAPVPVDPSLKEEAAKTSAKKAAINDLKAIFNTLYEASEDADGNLMFKKKGTTEALVNANGDALTPLEIIKKNHSLYLAPQGRQQAGGGTGTGGSGQQPAGMTFKDILIAAGEKGLKTNSPDWHKFVKEEKTKAGIK